MDTRDFASVCRDTLQFLQEFIDSVSLNLTVARISEDEFCCLALDSRSLLNWRSYFGHYLSEDSFNIAKLAIVI